jgi:hypothetical protein
MGDGQQSRSIGEGGNAMSGIESGFEQAWAHLERGFFTRQARYVTRQNDTERISRRSRRRGFFLKRLDFEPFQRIVQSTLFFFEIFLPD